MEVQKHQDSLAARGNIERRDCLYSVLQVVFDIHVTMLPLAGRHCQPLFTARLLQNVPFNPFERHIMAMKPKHFYIPEELLILLVKAAQADGRSVNNYLIERILKPYFEYEPESPDRKVMLHP